MPLRFSEDGPEFPSVLIDDLLAGNVVFLCGAGVSTPQLPGFRDLVDQLYERIGLDRSEAENLAYRHGRYEEALGSLGRRLAEPHRLLDEVTKLLAVPASADLSKHEVILRLARSQDNSLGVVTTNFDTLFERALRSRVDPSQVRAQSFAGQSLPAPGTREFAGIVHLHGRLADPYLEIDASPLVLTSAAYGDAYMRSAWASRFLFDLVRCRTLVLVGYSAGDAPVRYLLNVLESDRDRFPDLRKVYALDGTEGDRTAVDARWTSLAVEPLAYRTPTHAPTGHDRHAALWRDLSELADLVERPRATRRRRLTALLSEQYSTTTPARLDELAWLIGGKRDAWDLVVETVQDPEWFDHLTERHLWSAEDAAWVLAAWCARDWTSQSRLDAAIRWRGQHFGEQFGSQLEFRVGLAPRPEQVFCRAWLFLARSSPGPSDWQDRAYSTAALIRRGEALDADLRKAVALLTPRLETPTWHTPSKEPRPASPRLRDLIWLRHTVDDRGNLSDLANALLERPEHAKRVMELCTEAMRTTVLRAREAELVGDSWDESDLNVPTVEAHPQNEHHDGLAFLAPLATRLLPVVVAQERSFARRIVESWGQIQSRLGTRLWLYAHRNEGLFTPAEAASAIAGLSREEFWIIRRELILLMEERLRESPKNLTRQIERRILAESRQLFADRDIPTGQTDWRPRARDQALWLRLTALDRAGVLSDKGRQVLNDVGNRDEYLRGQYDESDLFHSYSSGVRYVKGDAAPLIDADPEERLAVAHRLSDSRNLDDQHSWQAFCRSDPASAFNTLSQTQLNLADSSLWNDLLGVLSAPTDSENEKISAVRRHLLIRTFTRLGEADDEFLASVAARLGDCLSAARLLGEDVPMAWWDRLWAFADADQDETDDDADGDRFYGQVINTAAGRLAQELLFRIELERQNGGCTSRANKERLRRMVRSTTRAGELARGACTHDAGFLFTADRVCALRELAPRLNGEDPHARQLRAVLVENARLGRAATQAYKPQILQGVIESRATSGRADNVASKIIFPLFSQFMTDGRVNWGLKEEEVRRALRDASDEIRVGASECISVWTTHVEDSSCETTWRKGIRPLLKAIWPAERRFKSREIGNNLAAACVASGEAFPEAFDQVRSFLVPPEPDDQWFSIHFLENTPIPDKFPDKTLDLLWIICGPPTRVRIADLATVLDRLVASNPQLEVDRRFQWLEQSAERRRP